MKQVCVLLLMVGLAGAATTYTSKYDNINLDEILNNERLYKKYLECLKGMGKCTPDGKELKDDLPEALENGCAKCTEKQKAGSEKVLKFLIENRKKDFLELEELYDPKGIYRQRYRDEAQKIGISLD